LIFFYNLLEKPELQLTATQQADIGSEPFFGVSPSGKRFEIMSIDIHSLWRERNGSHQRKNSEF
jgi:hypothetical protein